MAPRADDAAIERSHHWQLARWRLLADRLRLFAYLWPAVLVFWMTVYALEARLAAAPAITLAVLQAAILVVAVGLARRDAEPQRVRVVAAVAAVLLGFTTTVGFGVMGGPGEAVSFVILTLFLLTSILFAWGWKAELLVVALIVGPQTTALSIQGIVVSPYMMAGAIVFGTALSLLVAEVSRRSLEGALAIRESEARFRGVFDHAPLGMAVTDGNRRLVQVNRSFSELMGYAEDELVGMSIAEITHPDDLAATDAAVSKIIAGEVRSIAIEKRYIRKDGRVVDGLANLSPVRDRAGAPRYFVAQVEDIGVRKQRREALQASEARYRGLVESQRDLIARSDTKSRLTFANDAYCEVLGFRREDVARGLVVIADAVHPDDMPGLQEVLEKELLRPPYRSQMACRGPTPEGWRWFEWEMVGIRDDDGGVVEFQAAGRDVTERRAAEEQLRDSLARLQRGEEKLRALAARQVSIREKERKRLCVDLHDDVCQELVGIGIHLESLRRRLGPMSTENAETFDRLGRYLGALLEHLRLLARDLQPLQLHDYGLTDGLRSLAEGMSSEAVSVSATFSTAIPRLDEDMEVGVYRIAQEAVINAVRHADATAIDLVVAVEDGVLRLDVSDDGRGFDREQCRDELGLVSMEERAMALGGRFTLRSSPGEGTTVGMECRIGAPATTPLASPPAPRRVAARRW